MNARLRLGVLLAAVAGFAALLGWGVGGLPAFGSFEGAYGRVLNGTAVAERHAPNVPTAINFDFRAIDTLGEEFILFSAAIGLAVIVRAGRRDERLPEEPLAEREIQASDAVRVAGCALVPATTLLGLYVVTHGQVTPGGGFQGGVVLASAVLLAYLTGDYVRLRHARPWPVIEAAEATGAGGFALVGLAGLIGGAAYFANVLPLGPLGELVVGGTIPVANVVVALEVAAAFVMVFSELLEQSLVVRS